ncbi:competence/damage-inducible protein A [Bordetella genomosp. 12]|uniref:Competence/damage-inducible protein A n=1 Tax=Bordetella genomosp. 12 TaxID=463035 RepID=A0A261VBE7_9BORD|nr:molybdopterin-binding protein [Bordetella genomosp. 12]OZI71486.1 competence/damage-inducible protein A [Bordetella genomosp. 12]
MAADIAARRIGLIIVGDEILSGRRQDKHFAKVIEMLGARGMQLSWAEFLPDERDKLVAAYRRSFASGDIVFSCGGIGATPDDHTRQAAAEALGVDLALHPQAEQAIVQRTQDLVAKGQGTADMSTPENQQRLQMGVFPQGCEIIPNPYNRIPGFYIREHSFVPGFPVMAWPMLEWTLDTRYRELQHTVRHSEHSFLVFNMPESRITLSLQALESRWPAVRAFSLPSVGEAGAPGHIELGVKGEPEPAAEALEFLRAEVLRLGGQFTAPVKG